MPGLGEPERNQLAQGGAANGPVPRRAFGVVLPGGGNFVSGEEAFQQAPVAAPRFALVGFDDGRFHLRWYISAGSAKPNPMSQPLGRGTKGRTLTQQANWGTPFFGSLHWVDGGELTCNRTTWYSVGP